MFHDDTRTASIREVSRPTSSSNIAHEDKVSSVTQRRRRLLATFMLCDSDSGNNRGYSARLAETQCAMDAATRERCDASEKPVKRA